VSGKRRSKQLEIAANATCRQVIGLALNAFDMSPSEHPDDYSLIQIDRSTKGSLVRPKTIVFGRTYVLRMMFFIFFSEHEISEMRGPTGAKFCTMVSTRPNFIMPVQNFLGRTPKKFRGEKNMQNLARFRTTSKFGGEYLRNG